MSSFIRLPKGTKDCLPSESYIWNYIECFLRDKAKKFGMKEIRTPMFEYTELFLRGVGEVTDIVQKEMYTFNDKGNRSITLKAEGTAPTIRAFIEHGLHAHVQPIKLFYITPVFRYENVQKGRLRQHHQFGVEVFGTNSPICDVEIIKMAKSIYQDFGINDSKVHINSLGCNECRPLYSQNLREFLHKNINGLCEICKLRFEKNPLRILDCKNKNCKEILANSPKIINFLCNSCLNHFDEIKSYLSYIGVEYKVNFNVVRGLDYYTKTVFEIIDNNGIALCGGGRYDNLIEQLGGKPTPAFGFGMGIERLILSINDRNIDMIDEEALDLFIAVTNDLFKKDALKLCNELRNLNISCDMDYLGRNLKSQMKYANKMNAKNVIVIGEDEIQKKYLNIKKMDTGEIFKVDFDSLSILNNLN